MDKEKLNDIICQSSSDYIVLNNAYDYINNLEQQCKKQKEVIDKVIEYIKEHIKYECDGAYNGMQFYSYHLYDFDKQELLDIMKEVKE